MEETEKTVQTEDVKTEEKPVEKAASEETKAAPEKKKKTKKRIRINYKISLADIISTVAMIAVIVFVWVFVACGTGGATKRMAINKYFAAISKNDAKAYKILKKVVKASKDPDQKIMVALFHEWSKETYKAMPQIIEKLSAQGYIFLPLFYDSAMVKK